MIYLTKNLKVPQGTKALLWDMDGVIIDSMDLDFKMCSQLLSKYIGREVQISDQCIRDNFALDHKRFWEVLISSVGEHLNIDIFNSLLDEYETLRIDYNYKILPGVIESLDAARRRSMNSAVVSSNKEELIQRILRRATIAHQFEIFVGFDTPHPAKPNESLQKKPEPDTYLAALSQLNLRANEVVVIEDSIIGATAGLQAGCFVVGVATGGTSYEALSDTIQGNGYVVANLL